ncbi:protein-methionine-sulfoxide reductase catalytic subunit MsrP [Oceanibaculum sp.]|uniref:protein-methionine-sulfoxide reductase catalytic subunit MsrP n=1 Tax=Oceanibaculum sp. TaxID=1903597 RepID=UPI002585EC54|nr:protein-methionine-sulfoxide reductase catalytic subunit MsrP [Oceanibaculum sp.]MCH2395412.1 protein-methionine-sulfoxide reductase catalytic subunit MsrP [Oceanibaculum sp.]
MLIKRKKGWELPESAATPEALFRDRRRLMKGLAAGSILAAMPGLTACGSEAAPMKDPSASLYPAMRNLRYRVDREMTAEELATTYNNYYEFGSHKNIWRAAQSLPIRPWTVTLDGMVEKEQQIAIDDLLAMVKLEERVYRFRCVEAWAMTVPWTGFPMRRLVEIAKPLSGAKYVRMETFKDPSIAPGQKQSWYPWPYVEGLTMAEATNELTLMATGIYGQPIPAQNGAPIRLITPWKYGFKQLKSIVRFTFTDERPKGFWEEIQGREYGFWANVNPEVPHPRWSQATERLLGPDTRVPTLLYNGYADFVADMYKGMEGERLFM